MSVGIYTGIFMKEDSIGKLMESKDSKDEDIEELVKKFTRSHHPRLLLALSGFGLSLYMIIKGK